MSRRRRHKAELERIGATLAEVEREKAELESLVASMRCVVAYYEEQEADDFNDGEEQP